MSCNDKFIVAIVVSVLASLFIAVSASATEPLTINSTNSAPLLDGHCDENEWRAAVKIELPTQISLYIMHDEESLFVCAKGKPNDYTVVDLFVEHPETGQLYKLHASAQLGERLLSEDGWDDTQHWNLEDWSGFWVPFAGYMDTENGRYAKFLKGTHREIQVLRKKFTGNTWKMMIGVGGINIDAEDQTSLFYPKNAIDTDSSTWQSFSFFE